MGTMVHMITTILFSVPPLSQPPWNEIVLLINKYTSINPFSGCLTSLPPILPSPLVIKACTVKVATFQLLQLHPSPASQIPLRTNTGRLYASRLRHFTPHSGVCLHFTVVGTIMFSWNVSPGCNTNHRGHKYSSMCDMCTYIVYVHQLDSWPCKFYL